MAAKRQQIIIYFFFSRRSLDLERERYLSLSLCLLILAKQFIDFNFISLLICFQCKNISFQTTIRVFTYYKLNCNMATVASSVQLSQFCLITFRIRSHSYTGTHTHTHAIRFQIVIRCRVGHSPHTANIDTFKFMSNCNTSRGFVFKQSHRVEHPFNFIQINSFFKVKSGPKFCN